MESKLNCYNSLNLVQLLKSSKILNQIYEHIKISVKPYIYIYILFNVIIIIILLIILWVSITNKKNS